MQQNYLSGIFGGITMEQLRTIRHLPEVEVAAPVAMIGYILPAVQVPVVINDLLTTDQDQLYRFTRTWTTDRGLTTAPDKTTYKYFTRRPLNWKTPNATVPPQMRRPGTSRSVQVCDVYKWYKRYDQRQRSAFDYGRMAELGCDGSNPPRPGRALDSLKVGQIGFNFYYQFPMLMAAIDPVQEAKLVGLDDAVIDGRYLTADDQTRDTKAKGNGFGVVQVPVLMVDQALTDDQVTLQVERLKPPPAAELVDRLTRPKPADWAATLKGRTVKTVRVSDQQTYARVLRAYGSDRNNAKVNYWSTDAAGYERTDSGALRPAPVPPSPPETFRDFYFGGYSAPAPSGDVEFRKLSEPQQSSTQIVGRVLQSPSLKQVGVFDPDLIEGFSELSEVPLTTYYPPDAAPGNARTDRLLRGKPLLPNANLGGYLQQPPMVLTTIKSLKTFYDPQALPRRHPGKAGGARERDPCPRGRSDRGW